MLQDEIAVRVPRLVPLLSAALLSALIPLRAAEAWGPSAMCQAEPESLAAGSFAVCDGTTVVLPPVPLLAPAYADLPDFGAMRRARRHLEADRALSALTALRALEGDFPRIADHIALLRGEAALRAERPELALASYTAAERSIDSTVRLRARVGRVRSLLPSIARRPRPS